MFWHSEAASRLLAPPVKVKHELFGIASLTKRLSKLGVFSVQVISQKNTRPWLDESQRIASSTQANIREVYLYCNDSPVVFARTVLPLSALRREFKQLVGLGNKSLGAVLHGSRHIVTQEPEIAVLTDETMLYHHAAQGFSMPEQLWARRTAYSSGSSALLVHEVFLPAYWRLL